MVAEAETQPAAVAASARKERFLRVRLKGKVVARVLLNKPRLTIGRSPRSDIVLDEAAGVSREHAHILIVDGEVLIEDLSSRNGTFVNGRLCQRRTLEDGDRIAVGNYRLRYRDPTRSQGNQPSVHQRIAALLEKWNDAAIVGRDDACPVCSAAFDAPDQAADDTCSGPARAEATAAAERRRRDDELDATATAQQPVAELTGPTAAASPEPHEPASEPLTDREDDLAGTDAMPQLSAVNPAPAAPSAIVLVPDGMRQPAPRYYVDDAIPSGLASTGDTMEGMFPELFLVPQDAAAAVDRPPPAPPQPDRADAVAAAEPLDSASDSGEHDARQRRFRRALQPGRRLPKPRKR